MDQFIVIEGDPESSKAYECFSCSEIDTYIKERDTLSSLQGSAYDPSVELIVEDKSKSDFSDFLSKIGSKIAGFFSGIFDFMKQHLIVLVAIVLGVISLPVVLSIAKKRSDGKSFE